MHLVPRSALTLMVFLTQPVCAAGEVSFKDVSLAELGSDPSWKFQLSPSCETWLGRLDRFAGLDPWSFQGISVADINSDGWDDLYVSQPGGLPNLLYIKQLDGVSELAAPLRLDLLDKTRATCWVDLDDDSDPDLIVATSAGVAVLENKWPEPFIGRYFWPSLRNVIGITSSDFDGDGHLDLVFARGQPETFTSDFPPSPDTLPVAGNGSPPVFFRGGPGFSLSYWPDVIPDELGRRFTAITYAVDIDGDARPDLVLGNSCGPALFLRNTRGNAGSMLFGEFPPEAGLEAGSGIRGVFFRDLNGDGVEDFLFSGWADGTVSPEGGPPWLSSWRNASSSLLAKPPGKTFSRNLDFGNPGNALINTWGGVCLDLDLDGWNDLALAQGGVSWVSPSAPSTAGGFGVSLVKLAGDSNKSKPTPSLEGLSHDLVNEVRRGVNWQSADNSLSFLVNQGGKRLVPVPSPGIPGDGRSLVSVDWNSDARPDLAYLGRGGPQLRILQNESLSKKGLSLRLKGASAARHSAGAHICLKLADGGSMNLSISAGGNFLGQSSSDLFVGVDPLLVTSLEVRWAWSATPEIFQPSLSGNRWLLVEGTGVAKERASSKSPTHQESASKSFLNEPRSDRLYGTGNEPILPLSVQSLKGESFLINDRFDRPTVLVIFGTSDKAASAYLKILAEEDRRLRLAGARVIALCVDAVPGVATDAKVPAEAAKYLSSLNLPYFTGLVDESGWLPLRLAYEAPMVRIRQLKPASVWLLGATGAVHVFYEGLPKVDDLVADVKAHLLSNGNRWKLSLPFSGRWMVPPETVAGPEMAAVLADRQNPLAAWRHIEANREYFGPSIPYARFLAELGVSLKSMGHFRESIQCFREALLIAPNTPSLMNNLAWVLLITPDPALRDPVEALRLARICNQTKSTSSTVFLDTLAVALAANDFIPEAIDSSVQANEMAKREGDLATLKVTNHRLQLFRQGKPWLPEIELGLGHKAQGKHREAIQAFREALGNAPNTPFLMNELAWALLTARDPSLRNPAEALRLAHLCNSGAVGVTSEYMDTLALAFAASKKWEEAVEQAVKALEAAKNENDTEAARDIGLRLELFRQGKSWPP